MIGRLLPMFLELISQTVIDEPRLERAPVRLRRHLLAESPQVAPAGPETSDLPVIAALALHCFINENVYVETSPQ